MGVSQSSKKVPFNVSQLTYVAKGEDKKYGEVQIYKDQNNNKVAICQTIYQDSRQFEVAEAEAQRQMQFQNDSLVKLIEFNVEKSEELCSSFYQVNMLYEFLDYDLQKDIQKRAAANIPYEESELWHILLSVICALAYLKNKSCYHSDIRPNTILITNEGQVKIVYQIVKQKNLTNFMEHIMNVKENNQIYLSPILLRALQAKDINPVHQPSKSDVFSLAMSTLEAALLQPQQQCYDLQTYTINNPQLLNSLNSVRIRYSDKLANFLNKMLNVDEAERLDVDALYYQFDDLCKQGIEIAAGIFSLTNNGSHQLDNRSLPKSQIIMENLEPITHTPVSVQAQNLVESKAPEDVEVEEVEQVHHYNNYFLQNQVPTPEQFKQLYDPGLGYDPRVTQNQNELANYQPQQQPTIIQYQYQDVKPIEPITENVRRSQWVLQQKSQNPSVIQRVQYVQNQPAGKVKQSPIKYQYVGQIPYSPSNQKQVIYQQIQGQNQRIVPQQVYYMPQQQVYKVGQPGGIQILNQPRSPNNQQSFSEIRQSITPTKRAFANYQ